MGREVTPPTIGHGLTEYLPRSQTFVYTLLRHQRRYRPVVLAEKTANLDEFPMDPVVEVRPRGLPVHRRAAGRLRAYAAGIRSTWEYRIVAAARRYGCEAIHGHFLQLACRFLDARARLDIPLVTTCYGYDLAFGRRHPRYARAYERLFAEGSLFVCEGPAMARQLEEIGCRRDRIRLVRIGIDLGQFPFLPRPRERPLVIVQAGRFVEKKGFDLSIRAYAAAAPRLGESRLWLIGDGPERDRLEDEVRSLGLERSVRLLGMLPFDRYRAAMRRAHIGIQPSRTAGDGDTEGGAPTVLLEMQAAGMPIVATRHADIPTVVADPTALCDENDVDGLAAALVELAELGEDDWSRRTREARAFVERQHDAAATAAAVERVYDELLELAPPETAT